MPFISNDVEFKLIDEEEYVENIADFKDYVVVRKLFVRSNEPFFDDNHLAKKFRKYGPIDSTEVLENRNEGFVTFVHDYNAYLAFLAEKESGVEIAYSWKQPKRMTRELVLTEGSVQHEQRSFHANILHWLQQSFGFMLQNPKPHESPLSPLLQLNNDCLYELFDRCDNKSLVELSETCKQLSELLKNNYGFPKINKTFAVCDYGKTPTLAESRKMLRLMGSHFNGLSISIVTLTGDNLLMVRRYLEQIVKYCSGGSINLIYFHLNFCKMELIQTIVPLLENLHTLGFMVGVYETDFDVDFTTLCPNLKILVLHPFGNPIRWRLFLKNTWPSLETLFTQVTHQSLAFCDLNPQLKCFGGFVFDSQIRLLPDHMPNIEEMSLSIADLVVRSSDLLDLNRFQHLAKLRLTHLPTEFATEIIGCFTAAMGFDNLHGLELVFWPKDSAPMDSAPINETQQAVIRLARSLEHLEQFNLHGVKLSEETVINFVRYARKLKATHLHDCDVFSTESLVTKLVDVRKLNEQAGKLKMVVDNDGRNDLQATKTNKAQRYLHIDWNCSTECLFDDII